MADYRAANTRTLTILGHCTLAILFALVGAAVGCGGGEEHGGGHAASSGHGGGHGAPKKEAKPAAHGGGDHGGGGHGGGGHGDSGHGGGHAAAPAHVDEEDDEEEEGELPGLRRYPREMGEVDLGDYFLTRRAPTGELLIVKFHLVGLVDSKKLGGFESALATNQQRTRDQILAAAQTVELDQLYDATLRAFKTELVHAVQKTLHSPHLYEVLFTDFAVDRR